MDCDTFWAGDLEP